MRNERLLNIVSAVADAEASGRTIASVLRLDTLDLYHFLAVAMEEGLIERTPKGYTVSDYGIAWASKALRKHAALTTMTVQRRPKAKPSRRGGRAGIEPPPNPERLKPLALPPASPHRDASLSKVLGHELFRVAQTWRAVVQIDVVDGEGPVARARRELPPLLFAALMEVAARRDLLEDFESRHKLPIRSAKVVLKAALGKVSTYEELRPPVGD